MIGRERTRLSGLGFTFEMGDGVVDFLIRKGYHRSLGARPMRAVVERYLQDAIAARLLLGAAGSGRLVVDGATETLILQNLSQEAPAAYAVDTNRHNAKATVRCNGTVT